MLPEAEREAIELDMLSVTAKPVRDKPELLPVCFLSGQVKTPSYVRPELLPVCFLSGQVKTPSALVPNCPLYASSRGR